jgi:hypothetical protein
MLRSLLQRCYFLRKQEISNFHICVEWGAVRQCADKPDSCPFCSVLIAKVKMRQERASQDIHNSCLAHIKGQRAPILSPISSSITINLDPGLESQGIMHDVLILSLNVKTPLLTIDIWISLIPMSKRKFYLNTKGSY